MKLSRSTAALSLSLALAFAGHGVPAGATPFSATIGIRVAGIPGLGTPGTLPFVGAGSGTSTASGAMVPASIAGGTQTVPVITSPPLTALVVKLLGNGAAGFAGNPLAGTMPLFGGVAVKGSIGGVSQTLASVPFFTAHDPGSAAGADGIGVGGSILIDIGPANYLDVFNTDWTEGMKTVTALPLTYVYHVPVGKAASHAVYYSYFNGTAMYTGTDSRTPGGLGQVTLVSPTKVVTNLTGGLQIFVVLGTLTLNFVPEPGTLFLLSSGVAALAALGRRRMGRPAS